MTTDAVGGVWRYALDLARRPGRARHASRCSAVLGPPPTPAQREEAAADFDADRDRPAARLDGREPGGAGARSRDAAAAGAHGTVRSGPPQRAGALRQLRVGRRPVVAVAHSCVATWWHAVTRRRVAGRLPLADGGCTARASRGRRRDRAPPPPFAEARRRLSTGQSPSESCTTARNLPPLSPLPPGEGRVRARSSLAAGRLWDEGKNLGRPRCERPRAAVHVPSAPPAPFAARTARRSSCRNLHLARQLGRKPAWPLAYARATVFVSLARYEPFGLAVLEAARAGCALVLSDIPTFRELWDGAAIFVDPRRGRAAAAADRAAAGRLAGGAEPAAQPDGARTATLLDAHGARHARRPCAGAIGGRGQGRDAARSTSPTRSSLLEPRQRAFPARRPARAGRSAGTRSRPTSPRTPGAAQNLLARPRRGGTRRLPRCLSRAVAHAIRPDADLAARSTAPTSSSSTSGTSPRSSPRIGALAARRRRLHPAVPRHPPPRRQRPGRDRAPTTSTGYDGVLAFGEALARGLPRLGLGRPRLRLARGGRHAAVPPASAEHEPKRRPGLDRQLGRRRAQRGARAIPARARRRRSASPLDVHGVRYPPEALRAARALRRSTTGAGCRTAERPRCSPRHLLTVHVPRRFYATRCRASRPSACSRRWPAASRSSPRPGDDREGLFRPGEDYLVARDGAEMRAHLAALRDDPGSAAEPRRARASPPSSPAIPAPTASTSCSTSPTPSRARTWRQPDADRLLRLEPALVLLERRGHLLPRPARARWPALGHDITFYEPDAFDRQQHRDIDPPDWAASSSTRRPGRLACRASPKRPAADVVVKASGVGVFDDELLAGDPRPRARPGRAPPVLGRRRAGDTRRDRADPDHPLRAALPQLDLVLTYGGGAARRRGLPGSRRPPLRARSTTPSTRRPTTPCRPTRASPPTSPSSPTACPTARRRVEEFFLDAADRLPGPPLPARRQWLGRQADARQRARYRPRRHRRPQRLQLLGAAPS